MFRNNQGNNIFSNIPPVTKHLLIINVLIFLAGMLVPKLGNILDAKFALYYWGSGMFNPAQIFTYMFLHGSPWHLFFNMFALLMFGRMLESVWGQKRFLLFYIVCGVGAALVQELVTMWQLHEISGSLTTQQINFVTSHARELINDTIDYYSDPAVYRFAIDLNQNVALVEFTQMMITPCVGASGAIFGLLMGFAFLFPNLPMYIMFIPVPIKAKWMVLGYAVLEFFFGVSGYQAGVAHFAHLGGLLFGFIVLCVWYGKGLFNGGSRQY